MPFEEFLDARIGDGRGVGKELRLYSHKQKIHPMHKERSDKMRSGLPLSLAAALTLIASAASQADQPPSPAPQSAARLMLRIEWKRGPDLPQGFQDSDGGILGDTLITAGGFCSGVAGDNLRKPGRYPRGFLSKAWGLDLGTDKPAWQSLPEFPGAARQGLFAVQVGDSLCFWGGFNYTEPFCYADGWRLQRIGDQWRWSALPALPYPLTSSGACAVGNRVYVSGGADYDGVVGFFTESDRAGRQPRLGARLLVLDTADLAAGWKTLPDCPGTPRFVHAMQNVRGQLYVLGGATGADRLSMLKASGYCSVVDNWRFDPATEEWSRLRDLPVSSGNFPKSSNLVYKDRYIVLPGGHQYDKVANPDGTVREKYGQASQKRPESGLYNNVFIYDTQTDLFGAADALPIDNNLPMAVVRGDRVYLLGGETGGGVVDGEFYGHHPDLLLVGRITAVD